MRAHQYANDLLQGNIYMQDTIDLIDMICMYMSEFAVFSQKYDDMDGPFIGNFPIKTSIHQGFSIATFDCQRASTSQVGWG